MPEDRPFNSLISEADDKDVMWWWCTTEASRRDRVGCILDSHSVDYGLHPFNCQLYIFIVKLYTSVALWLYLGKYYYFGSIRAFHNVKHSFEWTTSPI